MATDMFLYWGSGSIPCWKPLLVLQEKQLKYNEKIISFSKKEHKSEEIMKLNPRGQVPTFRDADIVINESGAICDYLEFRYGDKGQCLLPKDYKLRARVLQRVHEAQNIQKILMEGVVYYFFRTKPEDIDTAVVETKLNDAREELQKWENYLQQEGGYAVGKDFTMADVYLFPFLAFGVRSHLNLEKFPTLNSYYKRVLERPSVQATLPPHWKEDAPKEFFKGL